MDLDAIPLFKLMSKKMDWLTQRHQVVAENVANIDTPKYQPRDITPFTFRSALSESRHLAPAQTAPGHQSLDHGKDGPGEVRRDRKPYETKASGNAVVAEEQMMKTAQTAQDFNTITGLYRKNINLLKMAIGRSGS